MSYVRRTYALIEGVQGTVDAMKVAELQRLRNNTAIEIGTPLHVEVRDAVVNAAWEEAPDLRSKMPDSWCQKATSVDVRFTMNGDSKFVDFSLEATEDDRIKLPPTFTRWDTIKVNADKASPMVDSWLTKQYSEKQNRSEVHLKFDNIKVQLTKFLESHASLNTAIKEMPELEMYVPQEYLDKLNKKAVRPQAKKKESSIEELNIDVNALTQIAVGHRITTSGGF
jgi:hypothetical protein